MTEMTDKSSLPPSLEQFVLRWGDMGGQWGVNRSVAQIHALLFVAERPATAEEIAETLGIARSNVSNSLRELLGWKLIRRVPVLGDRRDHYEAEYDLWLMATRIAQGRKEREIDPALAALCHVMDVAEDDARVSATARARLREMQEFVTTIDRWYDQMLGVPPAKIMALIKMGARIVALLGLGKKANRNDAA